jgi:hypothetical protein
MKRNIIKGLIPVVAFLALLSSCGAKYSPLTEEQKAARADSIFMAQEADLRAKAAQDCEAGMASAVDAKVAEMQAAASTANN